MKIKKLRQQDLDTIEYEKRLANGEIDEMGEFTKKGWKIHG